MLAQIFHELLGNVDSNTVRAVVIVSERYIFAFAFEVDSQTTFVTDHFHFRVTDGSQRVGNDRKAGDTGCADTFHISVMKPHLECFIRIFVVHVVNDLQSIDIDFCQPAHHLLVFLHHFVVIQILAGDRFETGSHLHTRFLVTSAIDRIQQALCQVGTSSEILHLLTDLHRRHTAGDTVIVAIVRTHQIVVLVLDGRGIDRYFCAEVFPVIRSIVEPKHRQVGFGCRAEVIQGMQITVRCLCHQRTAVNTLSAQRFSHPNRVAGEQVVVFRSTQETDNTQFDNKLVDQFLCLFFRQLAFANIFFDIDIEESRSTSERHGCSILILYGCQVSQIQELHGFAGILCRTCHIETITGTHFLKCFQRFDLLRYLLTALNDFFCQFLYIETFLETFLFFDQDLGSVQRYTTVITDDTSASVGIRQPGNDGGTTCRNHLVCIG